MVYFISCTTMHDTAPISILNEAMLSYPFNCSIIFLMTNHHFRTHAVLSKSNSLSLCFVACSRPAAVFSSIRGTMAPDINFCFNFSLALEPRKSTSVCSLVHTWKIDSVSHKTIFFYIKLNCR